MEKKINVYEHPEMEVIKLETKPLLAGSDSTGNATGEEMNFSEY